MIARLIPRSSRLRGLATRRLALILFPGIVTAAVATAGAPEAARTATAAAVGALRGRVELKQTAVADRDRRPNAAEIPRITIRTSTRVVRTGKSGV